MNTTHFLTLHFTSLKASEGVNQRILAPTASERALVFRGGGSASNAWEIGVVAGEPTCTI
jgi:hypothetical protein